MNTINISGNLCADAEIRDVGDSVVTEFRMAHNEKFKSNGREVERTSYFTVERWGASFADFAADYLRKGAKVYVTGTLRIEKWEARDGSEGTTVKIRAYNVDLETWPDDNGGSRGGGRSRGRTPSRGSSARRGSSRRGSGSRRRSNDDDYKPRYDDDDIPF